MIRETYRGRKLAARKGSQWGTVLITCNGEPVSWPTGRDLAAALAPVRAQIDFIDREPVNGDRWGAWWYAPGTFEMCAAGIHPQVIGGPCQHSSCQARAATECEHRGSTCQGRAGHCLCPCTPCRERWAGYVAWEAARAADDAELLRRNWVSDQQDQLP